MKLNTLQKIAELEAKVKEKEEELDAVLEELHEVKEMLDFVTDENIKLHEEMQAIFGWKSEIVS